MSYLPEKSRQPNRNQIWIEKLEYTLQTLVNSIPGTPHSDEILMLKIEGFFFFSEVFIEFSRSNVIKNNIMVTSEAMLVQ